MRRIEERDDVTTLLDIEAIKQLKARYCRYLDAKDWNAWRELFDDDFTRVIAGAGDRRTVGADDFVVYVAKPSAGGPNHVHRVPP